MTVTITEARVTFSENNLVAALRSKRFDTLAAFDDAVCLAATADQPPTGLAYDKTGYEVVLSDGTVYRG